jgi:hypothetical protein
VCGGGGGGVGGGGGGGGVVRSHRLNHAHKVGSKVGGPGVGENGSKSLEGIGGDGTSPWRAGGVGSEPRMALIGITRQVTAISASGTEVVFEDRKIWTYPLCLVGVDGSNGGAA